MPNTTAARWASTKQVPLVKGQAAPHEKVFAPHESLSLTHMILLLFYVRRI
jgi:hypothetical protein